LPFPETGFITNTDSEGIKRNFSLLASSWKEFEFSIRKQLRNLSITEANIQNNRGKSTQQAHHQNSREMHTRKKSRGA
jgi:hypothetical protein